MRSFGDPSSGPAARRPGRLPRAEELTLMSTLLDGPRRVLAGPIGRCVKRGWCRALIVEPPNRADGRPVVLYALTASGGALLEQDEHRPGGIGI